MSGRDTVYVEPLADHVIAVVLNQPTKKNAISAPMMDLLAEHLRAADADPDVHVVVLRGHGEHFSSGGDLTQSAPGEATVESARAQLQRYEAAIRTLRQMSTPVIAMVDGYAVGGAFALMLACDLVCVSDRVRVVPAFCRIGIVPEMGLSKMLPDLVGEKLAKEILFTDKNLGAEDLRDLRLANRVLAPEDLLAGTLELAGAVAATPPQSVQITKGLVNAAQDVGLEAVLQAETTASPFCTQTAGFRETMRRFGR